MNAAVLFLLVAASWTAAFVVSGKVKIIGERMVRHEVAKLVITAKATGTPRSEIVAMCAARDRSLIRFLDEAWPVTE